MFQKLIFIICISEVHTLEDLALINRITGILKLIYKCNSFNITIIHLFLRYYFNYIYRELHMNAGACRGYQILWNWSCRRL